MFCTMCNTFDITISGTVPSASGHPKSQDFIDVQSLDPQPHAESLI